jgi:hypothetical protein
MWYEDLGGRMVVEPAPQFDFKVTTNVIVHNAHGIPMDAVVVPPDKELTLCNQESWDVLQDIAEIAVTWTDRMLEIAELRAAHGGCGLRNGEEELASCLIAAVRQLSMADKIVTMFRSEEIVIRPGSKFTKRKVLPVREEE